MVRLVGSAGSLFRSYSARTLASAGGWAQAARARADASEMPLASVPAAQGRQGVGGPFGNPLVRPNAVTPQKEAWVPRCRRQRPSVAPGWLAIVDPPRRWTIRITAMDTAPVC